ncbi:hypothetical protein EVAR_43091_1 [Eumeta japonica]|uniref:Uncharacterized protein n=1 Tax=Eumeta variegata TaxID=151549 RepID=A0A4C1WUX2_EUMVA|nr:hypothetical protein EVAR_43091_1 [Eumeta japonica]
MVKAFDVFGKSDSEVVENEHVSHAFGDLEKSSLDEGSEDDDSLQLQSFSRCFIRLRSECVDCSKPTAEAIQSLQGKRHLLCLSVANIQNPTCYQKPQDGKSEILQPSARCNEKT